MSELNDASIKMISEELKKSKEGIKSYGKAIWVVAILTFLLNAVVVIKTNLLNYLIDKNPNTLAIFVGVHFLLVLILLINEVSVRYKLMNRRLKIIEKFLDQASKEDQV